MTVLRVGAVLSLTGRFARFGTQAGTGLRSWAELTPGVEVAIEDDAGEPDRVRTGLRGLARRCDILLGPYSTVLARAAGEFAVDTGALLWNHGGSGDDVQEAAPGHMISVLTPTSSYATSFVEHLAALPERLPLVLVRGKGSFGRQVIAGAERAAGHLGIPVIHGGVDAAPADTSWDLFTAGTFEHDVDVVTAVGRLASGPRHIGSVAAGVHGFADAVEAAENVFGVAQWSPGSAHPVRVGPTEAEFTAAYRRHASAPPDYPAVQVAAAAALAKQCVDSTGSTTRNDLFTAATRLRTSTLFGAFAVDPRTGRQIRHRMALVRWTNGHLRVVGLNRWLSSGRPPTEPFPAGGPDP